MKCGEQNQQINEIDVTHNSFSFLCHLKYFCFSELKFFSIFSLFFSFKIQFQFFFNSVFFKLKLTFFENDSFSTTSRTQRSTLQSEHSHFINRIQSINTQRLNTNYIYILRPFWSIYLFRRICKKIVFY